eukprot:TRINITY_DN14302_c0_g1_i1.p2 TRINITY_DN14302_c0_g1~~TRINITY_DN14302_c0_g1_i1.p2  ORF type:complete len:195 (+),score=32.26 TRINITY_DN14302_c0_g1_i1:42-587(+)
MPPLNVAALEASSDPSGTFASVTMFALEASSEPSGTFASVTTFALEASSEPSGTFASVTMFALEASSEPSGTFASVTMFALEASSEPSGTFASVTMFALEPSSDSVTTYDLALYDGLSLRFARKVPPSAFALELVFEPNKTFAFSPTKPMAALDMCSEHSFAFAHVPLALEQVCEPFGPAL